MRAVPATSRTVPKIWAAAGSAWMVSAAIVKAWDNGVAVAWLGVEASGMKFSVVLMDGDSEDCIVSGFPVAMLAAGVRRVVKILVEECGDGARYVDGKDGSAGFKRRVAVIQAETILRKAVSSVQKLGVGVSDVESIMDMLLYVEPVLRS